jgi:spore coat polysaccharide biosynthesis protein SpsF
MKFGVELQRRKLEIVNKIGVVILSRYSSSRLPGKALKEINGKKILEYIIERVIQVCPIENIVLATSFEASDDPIATFAENYGVGLYRGSLDNVARRFYESAIQKGWQYAIRINGDNIFLDINVLKEIYTLALTQEYDFISNVKGRTFPKGMSVEAVRLFHFSILLPVIENDLNYREHVTLYLYEHDDGTKYKYIFNNDIINVAGIQMALDTQEDLERSQKIINQFHGPHFCYNLKEIYKITQSIDYE